MQRKGVNWRYGDDDGNMQCETILTSGKLGALRLCFYKYVLYDDTLLQIQFTEVSHQLCQYILFLKIE